MKYLTSAVFAIFCVFTINAQNASFKWSDITNNTNLGLQNATLAFPTEAGFTVYSKEKVGVQVYAPDIIYITKFDASGRNLSTEELPLPERQNKDATLLKIIEGNGKLYVFSYISVKKDKKNVLYAQVYDAATATISDVKELFTLPITKVNNSGFFNVEISEDKSKLAVLINHLFVKKAKEEIEVLVLDADLNTVSNKKEKLSFDSNRAYQEELFVENDGTVTIIKKTNISKKEPITSAITFKNETVTEQTISAEKFYISDNKVITIKGKQYLLGFATDNAKPAVSMGGAKDKSFFIYNLSDKTLIKNEVWKPEIIKKVLGKGFINLKVKDILIDNDAIYLIGDCFSEESKLLEGGGFNYEYTYDFGPGVVVKLNVNGEVGYQSFIKHGQKQKNKSKVLGSFYPYLDNGTLQILANEKESVLKEKKIVAGRAVYTKAIVLKSFDATGNVTTTPFWNSNTGGKNDLVYFAPNSTITLNNNTFYVYAFGAKHHRFGKMTIE